MARVCLTGNRVLDHSRFIICTAEACISSAWERYEGNLDCRNLRPVINVAYYSRETCDLIVIDAYTCAMTCGRMRARAYNTFRLRDSLSLLLCHLLFLPYTFPRVF